MTHRSPSRTLGPLSPRSARRHESHVETIRQLLATGDRSRLAKKLRRGVTLLVDSGGRVVAPTIPVLGRAEVSDVLVSLMGPATGWTSTVVDVNGAPAMVFRDGSRVAAVLNLRIQFRRIAGLWAVLNPDKLRHWNTP